MAGTRRLIELIVLEFTFFRSGGAAFYKTAKQSYSLLRVFRRALIGRIKRCTLQSFCVPRGALDCGAVFPCTFA
jgi:hypothetical protein